MKMMVYPHRIRLRGPWECEPLAWHDGGVNGLPTMRRVTMPCHWEQTGLLEFSGRVRFRRRFGYPGRIDDHERTWLTFEGTGGAAEVRLNGDLLGQIDARVGGREFEVTRLLQARNELIVDVEAGERGDPWNEIALEVRCAAFLRGLRTFASLTENRAKLRTYGEIVGVAERPLELYIVWDRSVVAYRVVTATAEGQPFEIEVADLPVDNDRVTVVKVDLVNGATVWYTHEEALTFDQGK
jgi:hypothetical protein